MWRAKNLVRNQANEIFYVEDVPSAMEYTQKLFAVKDDDDSTPKKYVTLNGFSDPLYVLSLPTQGLVKTILACVEVLCFKTWRGDDSAERMLRVVQEFIDERLKHSRKK